MSEIRRDTPSEVLSAMFVGRKETGVVAARPETNQISASFSASLRHAQPRVLAEVSLPRIAQPASLTPHHNRHPAGGEVYI